MIPDTHLAAALIAEQFPQWVHLPVTPVATSGWDNRTFHLGEEMLIRLPSSPDYAGQVLKEQQWLPHLAAGLSVQIPPARYWSAICPLSAAVVCVPLDPGRNDCGTPAGR